MAQYKTGYADAFKRNKITSADLLTAAKKSYDEVVHLEKELKKQREELVDAHKDDRPQMVADIEKAEAVLAQLDEHLCKKIDGNEKMRAKVINMQSQRGKKKKDTTVVVAADGAVIADAIDQTPSVTPDTTTIVTPDQAQQTVVDQTPTTVTPVTYTSVLNASTNKYDVTSSTGEVIGSFDTEEEATKKIASLTKKKSNAWKWIAAGLGLAVFIGGGIVITNSQMSSLTKKRWFN